MISFSVYQIVYQLFQVLFINSGINVVLKGTLNSLNQLQTGSFLPTPFQPSRGNKELLMLEYFLRQSLNTFAVNGLSQVYRRPPLIREAVLHAQHNL